MTAMAHAIVIAMVAALVGCAGPAGGTEPVAPAVEAAPASPAHIRIELGGTATVEAGALEIRFNEVAQDSRCPKGETCVWEGDAVVRIALQSAGESGMVELHTASRLSHSAGFAGWFVKLVALDPVPVAGRPAPHGYVATLRVTQGVAPADAIQ